MGGLSMTLRSLAYDEPYADRVSPSASLAATSADEGWRDHISFEQPPNLGSSEPALAGSLEAFPPDKQQQVEAALTEIYSTPEGQDMIERAAAGSDSGRVHILHGPGITAARLDPEDGGRSFILGRFDEGGQYGIA
ncbi:MAG: hypothetical protein AAF556_11575, partial [Pseudomonadota bacterium]